MKITYKQGSRNVKNALGQFAKFTDEAMANALRSQADRIEKAIAKNLSGQELNEWTGDLKEAVQVDVTGSGKSQHIRISYGSAPYGAFHEKYDRPTYITIRPTNADKLFIPLKPGKRAGQPGLRYGVDYILTSNPVKVKRAPFIKPSIEEVLPGRGESLARNVEYEREFTDAWRKAFGS